MNPTNYITSVVFFIIIRFACLAKSDIKIEIVNAGYRLNPIKVNCSDKYNTKLQAEAHLSFNEYFNFECKKPPFWRDAECTCDVNLATTVYRFPAYLSKRDKLQCGNDCRWHLKPEGPWLADAKSPRRDPLYLWKPQWTDFDE